MRIIHFEDEWAKLRPIAHLLHDRIFERLAPELAVDLELVELEDLDNPGMPCRIITKIHEDSLDSIFEYIFVTDLASLGNNATKDDIVIVDIMRSDDEGHFISILDEVISLMRSKQFTVDRWRYFSAYPEKIPENCELAGFTKKEKIDLIDFLFQKVLEHRPDL